MGPEGLCTADRGNSTLDLRAAWDPRHRVRLSVEDEAGLLGFLRQLAPRALVASTVVDGGLDLLTTVAESEGVPLAVAGRDLPCPLSTRYQDPGRLGHDRWLGALAAHEAHGAALVVDCGTACTFNLVDAEGVFLGGAIAPGPQTMAQGLAARAPALPAVDLDRRPDLPATDPQAAVDIGVGLGFCALVEGLAQRLAAAGGLVEAPWLLTGGAAEVYLRRGGARFVHEPDLVHLGLVSLASRWT